jgi:uncharacterized membrane protein
MTLAPLLDASPVIKLHAFVAMGAFVLGAIQLAAPKGTISHRTIGWTWTALMMVMLGSAFFVHGALQWGPFDPKLCWVPPKSLPWVRRCAGIHLLTVFLFLAIPYAALHARRHNAGHHGRAMLTLLLVSLVVAGAFTLDTDRIMHAVVFGP